MTKDPEIGALVEVDAQQHSVLGIFIVRERQGDSFIVQRPGSEDKYRVYRPDILRFWNPS